MRHPSDAYDRGRLRQVRGPSTATLRLCTGFADIPPPPITPCDGAGPSSCRPALPAVADLERFEVAPRVRLHPAVDFVPGEAVRRDDLAGGYDLGGESLAQLDLASTGSALDPLEQIGAAGRLKALCRRHF
jgi:hypothetical protein